MLLLLVIGEPQRKDLFILDAVHIDRHCSNLEMSFKVGNSMFMRFNIVV